MKNSTLYKTMYHDINGKFAEMCGYTQYNSVAIVTPCGYTA